LIIYLAKRPAANSALLAFNFFKFSFTAQTDKLFFFNGKNGSPADAWQDYLVADETVVLRE
jgi:hypothetical protein